MKDYSIMDVLGTVGLLAPGGSITGCGAGCGGVGWVSGRTQETLCLSQHESGTDNDTGFAEGAGVSLSINTESLGRRWG